MDTNNKILYPRSNAQFYNSQAVKRKVKRLERTVAELLNCETVKNYFYSVRLLSEAKNSILRFECQSCNKTYPVKDLTLYRFISYSDGMDEWRYEDDNIICPNCGYYHYIDKKVQEGYKTYFKEIVERKK